ncbi:bacteriocin [Lactiplantibacillus plantarum]|nr:bacteriocin [Lactiplantibacillus plantarum]WBF41627.1 bacteriocin [Lactiplantibacillus plantarum]
MKQLSNKEMQKIVGGKRVVRILCRWGQLQLNR